MSKLGKIADAAKVAKSSVDTIASISNKFKAITKANIENVQKATGDLQKVIQKNADEMEKLSKLNPEAELSHLAKVNDELTASLKAIDDLPPDALAKLDADELQELIKTAKDSADNAANVAKQQSKMIDDAVMAKAKADPDFGKSLDELPAAKKTKIQKVKEAIRKSGKKGLLVTLGVGVSVYLTLELVDNMAQRLSGCFDSEGNKVAGYCWCTTEIAELEGKKCELDTIVETGSKHSLCANEYSEQSQIIETSGSDHPNTACQVDDTQESTLESIYNSVSSALTGNANTFDSMLVDNWAGQPGQWNPNAENSEEVRNKEICDGINCACMNKDTGEKIADFCSCSKLHGHSCNVVTSEDIFASVPDKFVNAASNTADLAANSLNCVGGNTQSCQDAICGIPVVGFVCGGLPSFLRPLFALFIFLLFLYILYVLFFSGKKRKSSKGKA